MATKFFNLMLHSIDNWLEGAPPPRALLVFRDFNDPIDSYDDLELFRRFRFSRALISQITELIANY